MRLQDTIHSHCLYAASIPAPVRQPVGFVQSRDGPFAPAFAVFLGLLCRGGFRTAVPVGIHSRHGRDAEPFRNRPPRQSLFIPEPGYLIATEDASGASYGLPCGLGCPHADQGTLADHLALKLRNRGEDLKHEAAGGVRLVGVESLRDRDEPDAVRSQHGELLVQVKDRAPEAVQLPDEDAIEAPLCGIGHQPIKGGAAGLGSAEARIDVLFCDAPSPAFNVLAKLLKLDLAVLVCGGNTSVHGTSHAY